MSENTPSRALALKIITDSDSAQRQALLEWSQALLEIRNSPISNLQKAKKAIFTTKHKKIILPILRVIKEQIKRHGWDNRTATERTTLAGVTVGLSMFYGQSAGLAALGGAVAVPLWVVLGAGGGFAAFLIEQIGSKASEEKNSSCNIIEAEEINDNKSN